MLIVFAYQVCVRPTNPTGITAFHQQQLHLRHSSTPQIHPRDAFRRDLKHTLQQAQQHGDWILLAGDFNENLDLRPHSRSVVDLAQSLGLSDVWQHRQPMDSHDTAPPVATYRRGQTRIDGAFASPGLLPALKATGFSSFSDMVHTDHRQLYMDFDLQLLLSQTHPLDSPTGRGLQSKRPTSVTTYITQVHAHLTSNNFFRQMESLSRTETPQPDQAEKLDRLLIQACQSGEHQCRTTPRPWWSTQIQQQRRWVSALACLKSSFCRQTNKKDALQLRLDKQQVFRDLPDNLATCIQTLRRARADLRQMTITSRQLREDEQLTRMANAQEHPSKSTRQSILKSIYHKERTAAAYGKFRSARRHQSPNNMTSLQIPADWPLNQLDDTSRLSDPKQATTWQSVETPEEIQQCITVRNLNHFGQAHGTPFTELPLSEDFDWQAGTYTADLLLEGEYSTKDFEHATQLLLRQCHRSTTLNSVPAAIDPDEFRDKFRKWCENTTTSPSGRHLGHFKALFARNDIPPETPEHDEFCKQQQDILTAYLQLLNYATKHRHVFDRWRDVVNVMIHKTQGDHRIHRLRVIHIYEADYNFLLGNKWRSAIRLAEKEQSLHPEQYGGRPGREASSLALLEELKVDISYAARRSLITFDNDASSCYDRIIPSLASLASRKFGVHQNLVYLNAETLRTPAIISKPPRVCHRHGHPTHPNNPSTEPGKAAAILQLSGH